MSTTRIRSTGSADRYLMLVREFPLRPIKTRAMHQRALRVLRNLMNDRRSAVADYKQVLASLIEKYEKDAGYHDAFPKLSPAELVRFLLEERDMSINALAKETGVAQSALSDMLNGKRDWSKSAIIAVADFFSLQPGFFLR
jgi:HTH-type transcriptional regulator/antitoxin HigA